MLKKLDALQSTAPLRPEFEASAALDIEAIHQIVERCRRRAQVSRPKPDSSPETEVGGRSFRAALDELPGLNDLCMFGVSCKVSGLFLLLLRRTHLSQRGQEQEVVWRLLNKMQAEESPDVASVFYVPKSPGRVYFEARSLEAVRTLCHGLVFLYFRSHVFVPLTERIALLQVGKSDPLIEAGTWVKVKDGHYKDDIGRVVSVFGSHDAVVVALRSRENLLNVSSSKRKRGQGPTRQEPYLLTKDKAEGLSEGVRIKVTDNVFKFGGKSYTTEGYLLLQLRSDRGSEDLVRRRRA